MCLIIDRPAGTPVPKDLMSNALFDNPDGWGIMFSQNGELVVHRGMESKDFWPAYESVDPKIHATIHYRWATHGTKNTDNTHPFVYGDYALMHNGVISIPIVDRDRSDTFAFMDGILGPYLARNPTALTHRATRAAIGKAIGTSNKLVIMHKSGGRTIINAKQGQQHKGLWLSNGHSIHRSYRQTWRDEQDAYQTKAYSTLRTYASYDEFLDMNPEWKERVAASSARFMCECGEDCPEGSRCNACSEVGR